MVIIKISGGLGNQLFQFALGVALEERCGFQVKYDIQEFNNIGLRKFELDKLVEDLPIASECEIICKYNFAEKIKFQLSKILGFRFGFNRIRYYLENGFRFDDKVFLLGDDVYLSGYWQSEKYFVPFKEKLLEKIKVSKCNSIEINQFLKQILEANSVSIHVRRGDYITNSKVNAIYGTCDLSYYERAIHRISSLFSGLTFFVFSDDMDWVKNHFSKFNNMIFVDVHSSDYAFEDLRLMSYCKHNIIANSTFSWWAAWLNQNKDKVVIAPQKWSVKNSAIESEIIPSAWIRL